METSWEVCNKVGGIYTVLSSRAATMVQQHGHEHLYFIGPKTQEPQATFVPSTHQSDKTLQAEIEEATHLPIKIGTWKTPGIPNAILVDYTPLFQQKDILYYELWEKYGIKGDIGYGDYDDSVLFAIAAAKVMAALAESKKAKQPIALFNEWTTGAGLLYLKAHAPFIHHIFITHATSVGRSIAGNGKPLYGELHNYNGDQMASELGVLCKHQVEKAAAHQADLFATVSDLTATEAEQLLDIRPKAILYNGFESDLVPTSEKRAKEREEGRTKITKLAETLYGTSLKKDPLIIATSGRFEYRNKGIDLYIDALRRVSTKEHTRDVIALILVPSWTKAPREELKKALNSSRPMTLTMQQPYITHTLHDGLQNRIAHHLHSLSECWGNGVYPIYIPVYLDGKDDILNIPYYQLLPAIDLSLFPSYYEPWGYTPLESIAMGVPTITTDKAGFGLWALENSERSCLRYGVKVLERTEDNWEEVSEVLSNKIIRFSTLPDTVIQESQRRASALARTADWHHFYPRYEEAYCHILKSNR